MTDVIYPLKEGDVRAGFKNSAILHVDAISAYVDYTFDGGKHHREIKWHAKLPGGMYVVRDGKEVLAPWPEETYERTQIHHQIK